MLDNCISEFSSVLLYVPMIIPSWLQHSLILLYCYILFSWHFVRISTFWNVFILLCVSELWFRIKRKTRRKLLQIPYPRKGIYRLHTCVSTPKHSIASKQKWLKNEGKQCFCEIHRCLQLVKYKIVSMSLATKEMEIKSPMQYHLIPKSSGYCNNYWEGHREMGILIQAGRNVKMVEVMWRQLKRLEKEIPELS